MGDFRKRLPEGLRSREQDWIKSLKKDPRFRLVQGREYFGMMQSPS